MDWAWFLDWEATEEFRREDYYLAQIAAQVERANVKNPSSVTIKKKLLKFVAESKGQPQTGEERIQTSKNFWKGITGAGRKLKQRFEKRLRRKGDE